MKEKKIKIIAVVGPTASGKTALAINLAKHFDGEIINADSRSIYQECSIATAKPTQNERSGVPHYLFDVVKPDEVYTVSRYKQDAEKIIDQIQRRDKLPIMVGGTGLYFDAVLRGFSFPPESDNEIRKKLENEETETLLKKLDKLDPSALVATDRQNRRRIIRALAVCLSTGEKFSNFKKTHPTGYEVLWLGIKWDKELLKSRIAKRAQIMIGDGVIEETKHLAQKYSFDLPAMTSIGYPIWKQVIEGKITLEQAKKLFISGDTKLLKKQNTWFKKNPEINWLKPDESEISANQLVDKFLSN